MQTVAFGYFELLLMKKKGRIQNREKRKKKRVGEKKRRHSKILSAKKRKNRARNVKREGFEQQAEFGWIRLHSVAIACQPVEFRCHLDECKPKAAWCFQNLSWIRLLLPRIQLKCIRIQLDVSKKQPNRGIRYTTSIGAPQQTFYRKTSIISHENRFSEFFFDKRQDHLY